jgi:hypothetical protein
MVSKRLRELELESNPEAEDFVYLLANPSGSGLDRKAALGSLGPVLTLADSELAYAESTISQTLISTTATDLTGLLIEFDVGARPVWVEGFLPMPTATANTIYNLYITDFANTILAATSPSVPNSNFFPMRVFERITTPGHYQRKLRVSRGAGSGTVSNGLSDDLYVSTLAAIQR